MIFGFPSQKYHDDSFCLFYFSNKFSGFCLRDFSGEKTQIPGICDLGIGIRKKSHPKATFGVKPDLSYPQTVHRTQFQESMKWCGEFINKFASNSRRVNRTTATVVQFSGLKLLEESYIPDNDGNAYHGDDTLKHYRVEYGPKLVSINPAAPGADKFVRSVLLSHFSLTFNSLRKK